MSTKWRKSKTGGKIAYASGKGLRSPCRCKRLWRAALWQEVGNPNAGMLNAFQPEPSGSALPSTDLIQFLTREPIDEASVNYIPPAGVCEPLLVDGDVRRILYPSSATRSQTTLPTDVMTDWKLENVYNNKWAVSYYFLEDSTKDRFALYPDAVGMIAQVPAIWIPFKASIGTFYYSVNDAGTPTTTGPFAGTKPASTYPPAGGLASHAGNAVIYPSSSEVRFDFTSWAAHHAKGYDISQYNGVDGNWTQTRYRMAVVYGVVIRFTDFKFFSTLKMKFKGARVVGTPATTGMILAHRTPLTRDQMTTVPWAFRYTINHPVGTGYFDGEIDLTSRLARNGDDIYVYFVHNTFLAGNAVCERQLPGDGYPIHGSDASIVKEIQFEPTFDFGGTSP